MFRNGIHLKLHVACWVVLAQAISFSPQAMAAGKGGWGLGVGYHNPVPADLGVSLLYLADFWAFEAALGAVGAWSNDDDAGASLGGDVDLKLVVGSDVRGYAQVGVLAGAGASTGGAGLSLGGSFFGAGLMLLGSKVYGQGGADYLLRSESVQFTATLGLLL